MSCPPLEAATRPRWILAIVDQSSDLDAVLADVRNRVPGMSVELATDQWPEHSAHPSGRTAPAHMVISRSEAASWRTIALLSSLRPRLAHEDIDVIVVTDATEELLPVHLTDFPGLRRIGPADDLAEAVCLLHAN